MTRTWLSVVPLTPSWLLEKTLAAESKQLLIMVCLRRDVRVQVLRGFSCSSALLADNSAAGVVNAQYALASIPYSRTAPYHPRFYHMARHVLFTTHLHSTPQVCNSNTHF